MSPARILADRDPEPACEWCRAVEDEPCEDSCDCPPCENERAAQDDYDAYVDRCRD